MTIDNKGRRLATIDTGGLDDVFPGALVTWLHVPRGGYGYELPIPAKVIDHAARPKTWVIIEVERRDGSRATRRLADVASLRWGRP